MDIEVKSPVDRKQIEKLKAGDFVRIYGTIYTARDAAHKRMEEALERGEGLPFDLKGNMIY